MRSLPTRRNEDWRYAPMDKVAAAWPLPEREQILVPERESFNRTIIQHNASQQSREIHQMTLSLGKHSAARLDILNIEGAYRRVEIAVTMAQGAHFVLNAAQIGGANQNLEIITNITHAEPGATSRQKLRSILAGRASGTYLGKITVARDAQKTDSEQDIKALLLERGARANARPELAIYADDVKCAHGCAVGEVDAAALYYLQVRGVPPTTAKKLILQAFIAELFDGAKDEEKLRGASLAKLDELI